MPVQDGVNKHLADAVAQMNNHQEVNVNTFRMFMIFSQLRIIELLEQNAPSVVTISSSVHGTESASKRKDKK